MRRCAANGSKSVRVPKPLAPTVTLMSRRSGTRISATPCTSVRVLRYQRETSAPGTRTPPSPSTTVTTSFAGRATDTGMDFAADGGGVATCVAAPHPATTRTPSPTTDSGSSSANGLNVPPSSAASTSSAKKRVMVRPAR